MLPTWCKLLVSVQVSEKMVVAYSGSGRSLFVFVSLPPADKRMSVPTVLRLQSRSRPGEKVRLRCTSPNCIDRGGAGAVPGSATAEVHAEGRGRRALHVSIVVEVLA